MTYHSPESYSSMKESRDWYMTQLLQTNRKYEALLKKYVDHDVERLQAELKASREGFDSHHEWLIDKLERQEQMIEDMILEEQDRRMVDYEFMERSDFQAEYQQLIQKYLSGGLR